MKYKVLGKTNLIVSEIAFGALQFSRIDRKEAVSLVHEAVNAGINLIDTANSYPGSEEILGEALKGMRDKVYIITKSLKKHKDDFISDLNLSLKRLKTDYIDIFLFHSISNNNDIDLLVKNGVIEALLDERKKGKINHIGFSIHSTSIIDRIYETVDFSTLMIPLNFVSNEFASDKFLKKYKNENTGIVAMKPFGGGRLLDIELCFKFLRDYPDVIPVAGMQTYKELKENLEYVSREDTIDKNDIEKILEIKEELGDKYCRQCGYCMPCRQNIEIVEINFLKVYHKQMPPEYMLTDSLRNAVEKAKSCIECGECIEKCPFDINIIELMKENIKFYENEIINKNK